MLYMKLYNQPGATVVERRYTIQRNTNELEVWLMGRFHPSGPMAWSRQDVCVVIATTWHKTWRKTNLGADNCLSHHR